MDDAIRLVNPKVSARHEQRQQIEQAVVVAILTGGWLQIPQRLYKLGALWVCRGERGPEAVDRNQAHASVRRQCFAFECVFGFIAVQARFGEEAKDAVNVFNRPRVGPIRLQVARVIVTTFRYYRLTIDDF